jgi:hypothetical protein
MTATATQRKVYPVPTSCPTCHGKLWDNRESKKNPKAPDFKCRDKTCEGVYWPPKDGAWADQVAGAPAKQAVSLGGPMPWESAEEAPPVAVANVGEGSGNGATREAALFGLYSRCAGHVLANVVPKMLEADVGTDPEAVAAMIATLFIQANQRGLV